ncbi:OPT oligopeptide transporter protein-domain-containing protein [Dactylonectria macrodidyma]|uniref:OPT oligopeptide transporter protein-domain-containing protein n=1 Tax=Dactylonectria macrodidyma TaxID=307937 RepID=A0A9P9IZP4_9HYPO|nr:OPT oligopeptide transporter protein-domain-containing protein [Dactylonectria macrodidyma]
MCVPAGTVEGVRNLVKTVQSSKEVDPHTQHQARTVAAVLHGNSVYREVRAIISPTDDPEEPANTIRMWVIGLIWAGGLAAINTFFAPRQPAITVAVYLAQLFGLVMGKAAAQILPTKVWFEGSRFAFTLNPGPWSLKEQTLVTIMANVSYLSPLVTQLFFMQRLPMYMGQEWADSFGYSVCIMLSAQLLGFGLAGLARRFLVYPGWAIWFFVLSQSAMNKAFVTNINLPANGWKISQLRFFAIVFLGAWCYYWIPGIMFPTLTFFNWITWIRPTSAVAAIVTGTYYFNMGFNPISTFDYQWFATLDPFVTPFFVLVQIVAATGFWGLCVIIPVFFSNTWFTSYMPINSWFPYDNTGQIYQTSRILGTDHKLNQTAYEQYSPVFLPASVMLRYAGMLALLPALLVFMVLWYGRTLLPIAKTMFRRNASYSYEGDVHYREMLKYKEVPEWAYLAIAAGAMAFGFAGLYGWPTGIAGWVFPVSFVTSSLFMVPTGILCAVTGYITDLEMLFNIVGGFTVNGDPVASFFFKVMGKSVLSQAIMFTSDMKLGHYNKIPPRLMVISQLISAFVAAVVSCGIIEYQITGIPGICDPTVQTRWICSNVASTWTTAIVWGALGPQRLFAHTSMYRNVLFALLAGALWPVPWYLARKKWPNSVLRYCHPLVMMIAPILWAPLNFSNIGPALPVSFVFGYWIKSRYPEWWNKYNYILSTALLSGIAFSIIIQFVGLVNRDLVFPSWWGTTQYLSTCDMQDCRYKTPPQGGTFGPTEWH